MLVLSWDPVSLHRKCVHEAGLAEGQGSYNGDLTEGEKKEGKSKDSKDREELALTEYPNQRRIRLIAQVMPNLGCLDLSLQCTWKIAELQGREAGPGWYLFSGLRGPDPHLLERKPRPREGGLWPRLPSEARSELCLPRLLSSVLQRVS